MKKKFIYLILFFIVLVAYVVATPILPNQICWDFYGTDRSFCIKHRTIAHSLSIDGSLNVSGDINLSGIIGGLSPLKIREGVLINDTGNYLLLNGSGKICNGTDNANWDCFSYEDTQTI